MKSKCILVGLLVLAVGASLSRRAEACGGLFCSSATPVNQAAERIIFSFDRPAKKVTAVVEILYDGPAEKFAWVLPVPGVPEVGVSTSAFLDRLQQATNPLYSVQRNWTGSCQVVPDRSATAPGSAGGAPVPPGDPSVMVLATGSVGPYTYDVIKVDPAMSDAATVAIAWLTANNYDVGMLGAAVLRPYLNEGLNLLAFKLQKNKTAGSIRPVMLTYTSNHPMIPIRPTAVAANADMGILAFVLGAARAVPTNYKDLELNEALIDWFNPNATYNAVVSAAADEAGGQGFVTELATPTNGGAFASSLFPERFTIDEFRRQADGYGNEQLIAFTVQSFSTFAQGNFGGPFASRPAGGRVALDGLADVLGKHLKLPPGVSVDAVVATPACYFANLHDSGKFYCQGQPTPNTPIDLTGFDRFAYLNDVEALVIRPLEKTAQLFIDQPYLTRLYTTMSAADMTLDPEFDLNSELGNVSNTHTVVLSYKEGCPGDTRGAWEATIGGLIVRGQGNTWPIDLKVQKMPFNRRVSQLYTSGPGVVVTDNTAAIAQALGGVQPAAPPGTPGVTPQGDGGCTMAGRSAPTAAWALLALGLLCVRRARRR